CQPRNRFAFLFTELFHDGFKSESSWHQFPCFAEVVDRKHVEQTGNFCRWVHCIGRNLYAQALGFKFNATLVSALSIQDREPVLAWGLINCDRYQHTMFAYILLQV